MVILAISSVLTFYFYRQMSFHDKPYVHVPLIPLCTPIYGKLTENRPKLNPCWIVDNFNYHSCLLLTLICWSFLLFILFNFKIFSGATTLTSCFSKKSNFLFYCKTCTCTLIPISYSYSNTRNSYQYFHWILIKRGVF